MMQKGMKGINKPTLLLGMLMIGILISGLAFAYTQGNSTKGITYQQLPLVSKLTSTSRIGYIYEMTNFGYNAYFKNNSNTAEAVRYEKNGYFFTYDLSGGAMQWAVKSGQPNAKDTLGSGMPSNSQNTAVTISTNVATYTDAFYNTKIGRAHV